jgi:UDP-N-acetyl-D-mannosaminuronate dehydrogenase
LQKETILVLGLGEVGSSLYELFKENREFKVYGLDLDKKKMREMTNDTKPPSEIDVMHVCYPFVDPDKFIKTTIVYLRTFKPRLAIIESTVAPGITQKIARLSKTAIADSPIRGMHESKKSMKSDILFWTKYVGGTTKEIALAAQRHFEKLGLKVKVLKSPAETELAKLFETTYRAWMIACFQEMHRISRHYGASFDQVLDMMEDIHRHRFNKPLHYPDVIGGHCLIQNTELLEKAYDSEFLRLILKSNREREKEIKDKAVRAEVDKIKTRVQRLEEDLTQLADEKHASC